MQEPPPPSPPAEAEAVLGYLGDVLELVFGLLELLC